MNDWFKPAEELFSLLKQAQEHLPVLKLLACGAAVLAVVVAVGVVTYVVRTTFGPAFQVLCWFVGHKAGTEPHPLIAGALHGARLIGWAVILAVAVLFVSRLLWE